MRAVLLFAVCLVAASVIVGHETAEAKHTSMVSKPCSVRINGHLIPVMYDGQPRNNPDGTFYPADAFYYLAWFSASPTCVGLSVKPLVSYDGLDVEFHNMTSWLMLGQDWNYQHNPVVVVHEVDPFEMAKNHKHTSMELNPKHLVTTHYYSGDSDDPIVSIREDETPSSRQKTQIERILSEEGSRVDRTWEWDFAADLASHPHYPQCPPDTDTRGAKSGETIVEGDGPVLPCRVKDAYTDTPQPAFEEAVMRKCSTVTLYSGCVFGKVIIDDKISGSRCLFEELKEMGIDKTQFPDSDRCVNTVQRLEQQVTGLKQTCGKNDHGSIICKSVPVTRTVDLSPDILAPDMELLLVQETLQDSDGYDARNLDGTYYVWDPVTIRHVPELKWKNHRDNTIHFEVQRNSDLRLENSADCSQNSCHIELLHPGLAPSTWEIGNGDGLAIYNATYDSGIGLHVVRYNVTAYNGDAVLAWDDAGTEALVVRYAPVYSQYPYPLLSDDMRTSYENRAAVALHYFGSVGGGTRSPPLPI